MFSRRQLPLIFLANFQDVSKILKKKKERKLKEKGLHRKRRLEQRELVDTTLFLLYKNGSKRKEVKSKGKKKKKVQD